MSVGFRKCLKLSQKLDVGKLIRNNGVVFCIMCHVEFGNYPKTIWLSNGNYSL